MGMKWYKFQYWSNANRESYGDRLPCFVYYPWSLNLLAMWPGKSYLSFVASVSILMFHRIVINIKRDKRPKVLGTVPTTRHTPNRGCLLLLLLFFFLLHLIRESITSISSKKTKWERCMHEAGRFQVGFDCWDYLRNEADIQFCVLSQH